MYQSKGAIRLAQGIQYDYAEDLGYNQDGQFVSTQYACRSEAYERQITGNLHDADFQVSRGNSIKLQWRKAVPPSHTTEIYEHAAINWIHLAINMVQRISCLLGLGELGEQYRSMCTHIA